jgi:hypothetical protein
MTITSQLHLAERRIVTSLSEFIFLHKSYFFTSIWAMIPGWIPHNWWRHLWNYSREHVGETQDASASESQGNGHIHRTSRQLQS